MKKFLIRAISSIAVSVLSISSTINAIFPSIQIDDTNPVIINNAFKDEKGILKQFDNPFLDFVNTSSMVKPILEDSLNETRETFNKTGNLLVYQGRTAFQIENPEHDANDIVTITLDYDNSIIQSTHSSTTKQKENSKFTNDVLSEVILPRVTDEFKNILNRIPETAPITAIHILDFINNSYTVSMKTQEENENELMKLRIKPVSQDEIQIIMRAIEQYCLKLPAIGYQVTRK